MQPSPIQLKNLVYLGFRVWARTLSEDEQKANETPFDFNDVMIAEGVDVRPLDGEQHTLFAVQLHIVIENKEGKLAPYDVDIEVAGLFEVNQSVPKEDRRELVDVNGCSVLYGAIRDLVLNLSSRSANGPLMLPTVNFLDRRNHKPTPAATVPSKA